MRKGHDGDCTIYAALRNHRPEDGICTCGYAHESGTEKYSDELKVALEYHTARTNFISNAFDERFWGATPEIRAAALERLKNA